VRAVDHILKGMDDFDDLSQGKLKSFVRNAIMFFLRDKDE
jgi:hypothetical protein